MHILRCAYTKVSRFISPYLLVFSFRNNAKSTDHKVLCILHYFHRIFSTDEPPQGTVTYTRRCLDKSPPFAYSDIPFKSIAFGVSSTCLIEDAGSNSIQVIFSLSQSLAEARLSSLRPATHRRKLFNAPTFTARLNAP